MLTSEINIEHLPVSTISTIRFDETPCCGCGALEKDVGNSWAYEYTCNNIICGNVFILIYRDKNGGQFDTFNFKR